MSETKEIKIQDVPKKPVVPKGPEPNFASKAALKLWQEFCIKNATPHGHLVQDYARTLMLLMQGYLEEKPDSTVRHAVNFAFCEAYAGNLTYEQRSLAHTLIANCWNHGEEFSVAVNA